MTDRGSLSKSRSSSRSLSLLSRVFTHQSPPSAEETSTSSVLPCGSFPFDVFPVPGSNLFPGATNPWVSLPSQRFSRSQGLDPPGTCRPYFMPVPPLGFYPPGHFPPAEPYALSDAVAFMRLPTSRSLCHPALLPRLSRAQPLPPHSILAAQTHGRQAPLQGLAPRERPFSRQAD